MRLAIADPPYLGRANRWYGTGRGHRGGVGRAAAHEAAAEWDNPATHVALIERLDAEYDGWAIAASADPASTRVYEAALPDGVRRCVWVKGNAIPSGSRVSGKWEPVYVKIPEGRSAHRTGAAVNDVLIAGISYRHNYVGSKPYPWTHWVLDMLGYQPDDELHDLFAGSGAVTLATELHTPSPEARCAFCGAPIQQAANGRPRRTCSPVGRQRLARRTRALQARR